MGIFIPSTAPWVTRLMDKWQITKSSQENHLLLEYLSNNFTSLLPLFQDYFLKKCYFLGLYHLKHISLATIIRNQLTWLKIPPGFYIKESKRILYYLFKNKKCTRLSLIFFCRSRIRRKIVVHVGLKTYFIAPSRLRNLKFLLGRD